MAIFSGTMMDDILMGTMDDDVLWGGMGDDDLSGGAGDDRLIGGPGADTMNGGPGMDIASYTDSPRGIHVDMSTSFVDQDMRPPIRGGDAEGDALSSIEIIWGSEFADVIKGTHAHNHLFGNGGSDMLYGMRGNDMLRGGDDDDQLFGGDGMDVLYGDMGVDDLQGGMGNDMLFGGDDDDTLSGDDGHDTLEGGPGGDDLMGGEGTDTAAYTMSPEAVTVDLRFPPVNPAAVPPVNAPMGGDAVGDTFTGIENLRGSMYDDILIGNDMGMPMAMTDDPSTDTVDESTMMTEAGRGNKLFGNMGDDMLKGLAGNDTLHGGKGDDTLYGGADNDRLMGEMGDDALKGDDGDDTLIGGPGADKLFGGRFIAADMRPGEDNDNKGDTADYSKSSEGVTVSLVKNDHDDDPATPINIMGMGGDAEGDVLVAIENLTGSAHKDMLEGDATANYLKGMGGDDWNDTAIRGKDGGLFGGGGKDTLEGGAGNDWLEGQGGADTLKGGPGNDWLDGGEDGTRTTMSDDTETTANESEDRTLDTFDEVLEGGAGDDTLRGGAEVEKLDGGTGSDTADYTGHSDDLGVTLDPSGNFVGDTDEDMLVSIENLIGGSGNDTLMGNAGPNVLNGGPGDDTLTGGRGSDIFVFDTEGAATDDAESIADFSKNDGDMIDLEAFNLNATQLNLLLSSAAVTELSGADTGKLQYVLNLNNTAGAGADPATGIAVGAGTITITMDERFAELDAGDFII